MTRVDPKSCELTSAFPSAILKDVSVVLSTFPTTRMLGESFSVRVGDEVVTLPGRIHNDPTLVRTDQLTDLQRELVDCLMTRHSDVSVREKHLAQVIHANHIWVPPFVVKPVGEYVIEILRVVQRNLANLDKSVYGGFLRGNPEFLSTPEQRVVCYWNCYYLRQNRDY